MQQKNNLYVCKTFRRIDAALFALQGKEVHWNKLGLPCQIVRGTKGTFSKVELPTVFPHWAYHLVSWVKMNFPEKEKFSE